MQTPTLTYPVIGLTGRARSGKDTVAAFIKWEMQYFGIPVRLRAFADPLRAALLALDPIVDPATPLRLSDALTAYGGWEGVKDTRFSSEVRRLLQRLGTDSIRALDPEFWARAVLSDLLAHPDHLTILTDVRFPNEAALVQDLGSLYLVTRPHTDPSDPSDPTDAINHHISESGVDDLDHHGVIHNDGTLSALHLAVLNDIVTPYLTERSR